jgi:hypothetical protein
MDECLDFLGGIGGAPGQAAHLAGHHGKTAPLFACTGRFYRCVERQDVGLESNAINDPDDVANAFGRHVYLLHGGHHLAHHFTTALRDLRCRER